MPVNQIQRQWDIDKPRGRGNGPDLYRKVDYKRDLAMCEELRSSALTVLANAPKTEHNAAFEFLATLRRIDALKKTYVQRWQDTCRVFVALKRAKDEYAKAMRLGYEFELPDLERRIRYLKMLCATVLEGADALETPEKPFPNGRWIGRDREGRLRVALQGAWHTINPATNMPWTDDEVDAIPNSVWVR